MDLIYTNANREDLGVLHDYDLDLAFGADENNFECRIPASAHCCEAGSLLYMEGTEYGGIVDNIGIDTAKKEVIYKGRTWHGILGSKVILPLKKEEVPEPEPEPEVLPEGYTRLEYIESSGTQYIDTGFKPNNNTRVVMDCDIVDAVSSYTPFGVQDASDTNSYSAVGTASNPSMYYYGSKHANGTISILGRHTLDANRNKLYIDGAVSVTVASSTFQCSYNLCLCTFNNGGTLRDQNWTSAKIYSCLIYDNDVLVRDFIPCVNTENEVGLYDTVNGAFYGNAGTGFFSAPGVSETETNITETNIEEFFSVANESYYFEGSNGVFTSNNGGVINSTASTTLTALKDMNLSFDYSYSSEEKYDKFTLTVAGTVVEDAVSGSTTKKSHSVFLKEGQSVLFQYVKDQSKDENDDKCTFYSVVVIGTMFTAEDEDEDEAATVKEIVVNDVTIKCADADCNSLIDKYLIVSGDAVKCIAFILDRIGLSSLFSATEEESGVAINEYQFNRYTDAYSGLTKMLASAGLKLKIEVQDGHAVLSTEDRYNYATDEEFDSELTQFNLSKKYHTVNHMICLGSGEMENRTIVHLYADDQGNISQVQTQTDLAEYVAVFDYPNTESEEELVKSATEELKRLWEPDNMMIDFDDTSDAYDVGDIVGAFDNITGIAVSTEIVKKIVTVKNGQITISYKVGE